MCIFYVHRGIASFRGCFCKYLWSTDISNCKPSHSECHHTRYHHVAFRSTKIMRSDDAATIILSFQPKRFKLFLSKKSSLLVIHSTCINGARNRIKSGNAALVHIRQPKDFLCKMASSLLLQSSDSLRESMKKGCKVEADATKKIVIKAHAYIERNRKGDRLIECR